MNYLGTVVTYDSEASNLLLDTSTAQPTDVNNVSDVFQSENPATADVVFHADFE
jgi:hypothetical protein